MQFTDSARFIVTSISNLADNLAEGIHKIKYKYGHDYKNYETFGIKYKDCEFCLEYTNFKNDLIECKWLYCSYSKNYKTKLIKT